LDCEGWAHKNSRMEEPRETPLYLERIDPNRNMARFYVISVQPTLFGELSLIRNWGRIGAAGRSKIETFPDMEGLTRATMRLERRKRRRGYVES
jgi:predicted DNA-binding WGR domain protein